MVCFPNCKINIGLFVTARRADGYHDLETLFYPLSVRDGLEAVPAAETALTAYGLPVAGDPASNLVLKAFHLLDARFPNRLSPLHFHLLKQIPMGAGLGGGSANGAFALKLISDHFGLGLSSETLCALALELGSDCPFFIVNRPAFAKGRGEQLEPVPLSLKPYSIQLVCPEMHISTAAAFANIRPQGAPIDLRELANLDVADWRKLIRNDFEQTVFAQFPQLAGIKEELYAQGALFASLTGTGAAVYGIFPKGRFAMLPEAAATRHFKVIDPEF